MSVTSSTFMLVQSFQSVGSHVSQLFRWRKELCRIEEPSTPVSSTLVPVVVSEAAPAAQPAASEAPASSHPCRKRSDVTIDLGRGRRVRVDSDIDIEALAVFSIVYWVGDDPSSCWCEGLAGDGLSPRSPVSPGN